MTACTNNGGSRARRAVTAALVGVLSVGAAPMVALATGAAPASGDVVTMGLADDHAAFMAGTVAEYTVGGDEYDGSESVTLKKSELGKNEITITSVQPSGEGLDAVDYEGTTFYYKKATGTTAGAFKINGEWYVSSGTPNHGADGFKALGAGEYIAVAKFDNALDNFTAGGTYTAPAVSFTVTSDSLEGVTLQQAVLDAAGNPTGEYTDTLTYCDGQTWDDLALILDGKPLQSTEATFEVYAKGQGGTNLRDDAGSIQAGTYVIVVNGVGDYAGDPVKFEVTVNKLDLSKLGLYISDRLQSEGAPTIDNVEGANGRITINASLFDFASDGNKTWYADGEGEYTYTLTPKKDTVAEKNVTGTATMTLNQVVNNQQVAWTYDGHGFSGLNGLITVDRSVEEATWGTPWTMPELDLSKFAGTYKNVDNETAKLTSDQFEVVITDSMGNEVDSIAKKGVYYLTIQAKPSAMDWYADRSVAKITLTVRQGTVGEADTTFSFDGKVAQSINEVYDGQDFLSRVGVQVKSGDKTLAEGTDYEVTAYDSEGNEVDEIVDAGSYTIRVTSDLYSFKNDDQKDYDQIAVNISEFDIAASGNARVVFRNAITYTETYWDNGTLKTRDVTFVPYTGDASVPEVEVALTEDEDGEPVWTTLDSSLYKLSYTYSKTYSGSYKDADEVNEKGYYEVSVNIDTRKTGNFKGSMTSQKWNVNDTKVFVDVPNSAYYAQAIYTAVNQGYIVGLGGSNMFGPDQSISRADMVCVLYRMAGGSVDPEGVSNADKAYISDFEDVDPNAYYAKAVAWAVKAGVANGYGDTFGTERAVSTEEFVTMLARYAAICGTDTSVDDVDAVLAGTPDGDQVSSYAREAMAWAVESEYVGKDGNSLVPQGSVSRGRAVTIAVRYQPAQNDVVSRL
ncbi:S-layer homology domain-containing protein [Thermophilibacter mediterraneus]|uniref:S-layer homology domain-containing protein n=1 Tax=Thermophilibacter mediterraneus TaxID=1871031 RepID=UPI002356C5D7|nr:S-layer homology domain-containing protein [Thermophilibacter mediterraneus]